MKNAFFFALLSLLIASFGACGDGCPRTKEAFLQEYHQFIDNVCRQTDGSTWEKRDDRLRKYVRQCYPKFKSELNLLEQGQFWWGASSYYYARYGEGVVKMISSDELLNEVVKNLDLLGKNFDATIKEISTTWESVSNGAAKWWDTIKGVFE